MRFVETRRRVKCLRRNGNGAVHTIFHVCLPTCNLYTDHGKLRHTREKERMHPHRNTLLFVDIVLHKKIFKKSKPSPLYTFFYQEKASQYERVKKSLFSSWTYVLITITSLNDKDYLCMSGRVYTRFKDP